MKYTVTVPNHTFAYLTIEADDAEQALDKAGQEGMPYLCAQCSGMRSDDYSLEISDDWDWDNAEAQEADQ